MSGGREIKYSAESLVANVYKFFHEEASHGLRISLKRPIERCMTALGLTRKQISTALSKNDMSLQAIKENKVSAENLFF